jgi:hypothetical protein
MSGGEERYTGTESDEQALLASLRPSLDEALTRERGALGWWRSRPTSVRAGLVALLAFGLPIALTATMGTAFTPALTLIERAVLIGLSALALLLAIGLAMRPLHRPPPTRAATRAILAATLIAPLVVAIVAFVSHGAGPVGPAACLGMGLALSLPGLGLVWASARSPQLGATAFAAGTVAGLGGYLAIGLHCPHVEAMHVLVTHAPIVMTLGLLSALRGVSRRPPAATGGAHPR